MKKIWILTLLAVWIAGCGTTQPTKEYESSDDAVLESTQPAGVIAQAWDERHSEETGTIGIRSITVRKTDLTELVSRYLLHYIHEKIGLNAERIQMNEADSVKLAATKNKVNGIIILKIKELKIFAPDARLQATEVNLMLELTVFDDSGHEIYRRTVKRRYEKNADAFVAELNTDKFIEAAMKDALKQYVEDPALRKIIAKFKYGTVGGVIAGIF